METAAPPASTVRMIPIAQIFPSRHQARKNFSEEAINALAESMKQEGLIQPITIRIVENGKYELIAGERRLRAAKLLGWQEIEAKAIHTVSEAEASAKGLVENLQRQDLNPIEEAEGFQELNRQDPVYWTQDRISKVAGRTRSYVTQSIGFLSISDVVLNYVRRLTLTRSHLLELSRLSDGTKQEAAGKEVAGKDLSIRETRKLVDELLKAEGTAPSSPLAPPAALQDPMAQVWPALQANLEIPPEVYWEVNYGAHQTVAGPSMDGWFFFVRPPAGTAKTSLIAWFTQMGRILNGGPVEATLSPAAMKMREAQAKMAQNFKPRIPQTLEEELELKNIASKGLGAAYAWIYGADSPMAKMMANHTWQEMGEPDSKAGLAKLLEGLRKSLVSSPERV